MFLIGVENSIHVKNAFLDTNIFLHYDIKSVDWCKELNSDEVEIVVGPTVLKELDEKKNDKDSGLAKRATGVLAIIEDCGINGNPLRQNVTLSIIHKEPNVDWQKLGLDSFIKDDRILATIIERNNDNDFLVTDDYTPRIKASSIGIKVVKLKAERKTSPRSELEKEAETLRKRIHQLENRIPDLSLELSSSADANTPTFYIEVPQKLSKEDIKEIISKKENVLKNKLESVWPPLSGLIDRYGYHQDVKKYMKDYEEFLSRKQTESALSIEIKFVLLSKGKAPAEDVYCKIVFPSGFRILREYEKPEQPKEPKEPTPITSIERMMQGYKLEIPTTDLPLLFSNRRKVSEGPTLEIEDNIVKITIKKLQHGLESKIEPLFVQFPSVESAKPFEICYEIHASNLQDPIKRRIPVKIEKRK